MTRLTTTQEVARLLGIHCSKDVPIKGFSVDSRTIQPGEIYCALKGQKVDGHKFLNQAFEKGACGAIVSEEFFHPTLPILKVSDGLIALQHLAQYVFDQRRPRHVLGITGTVGKTTSKDFTAALLKEVTSVFMTPGNSNSQVALPLAILNHFQGTEEVAVLEMGMSKPGEIKKLVEIAPLDVAIITKISLVHAENFSSLEEIAAAKGEIFTSSRLKLAILEHGDQDLLPEHLLGDLKKKTFSIKEHDADFKLVEELFFYNGHATKIPVPKIFTQVFRHNLLVALSAIVSLGYPLETLLKKIPALSFSDRRGERSVKNAVHFINDAYNASPIAVEAALGELGKQSGGKKIAVLGSMMELGKFSLDAHRGIGEFALNHVDHLICLGKECAPMVDVWKKKGKSVDYLDEIPAIVQRLKEIVTPGDWVLLKGSKSKELWKVLEEF